MEYNAVKSTPDNGGSNQPLDDRVRFPHECWSSKYEHKFLSINPNNVGCGSNVPTNFEYKFPPLYLNNVRGGGNVLTHPTIGVTNVNPEEVIDAESKYGKIRSLSDEQKELRRISSNRLSAQRSRLKKAKYIEDLEKNVKDLEIIVSALPVQIEHEKQQQSRLRVENSILVQKLTFCSVTVFHNNAQIEKTRAEIKKLKELVMVNANSHELYQQGDIMKDWNLHNSELDELTSASFYLQNGPYSLHETYLDQNLGINHVEFESQSYQAGPPVWLRRDAQSSNLSTNANASTSSSQKSAWPY